MLFLNTRHKGSLADAPPAMLCSHRFPPVPSRTHAKCAAAVRTTAAGSGGVTWPVGVRATCPPPGKQQPALTTQVTSPARQPAACVTPQVVIAATYDVTCGPHTDHCQRSEVVFSRGSGQSRDLFRQQKQGDKAARRRPGPLIYANA